MNHYPPPPEVRYVKIREQECMDCRKATILWRVKLAEDMMRREKLIHEGTTPADIVQFAQINIESTIMCKKCLLRMSPDDAFKLKK